MVKVGNDPFTTVGVVDGVTVGVTVGVSVGVEDAVKVAVSVGVEVSVGVDDGVNVEVIVGVSDGVAVALGDEEFHIEFTHGSSPGIISAYFLDAHMEDYVRLDAPSFSASVVIDGRSQAVVFAAVSNVATGEKIGDSSLFEGRIVGLPDHPALLVSVPALIVKGRTYANIKARLPAK